MYIDVTEIQDTTVRCKHVSECLWEKIRVPHVHYPNERKITKIEKCAML